MFAGTKTRQFGFVGFKTEEDTQNALKWFNGTFLHTSKLQVEVAKSQGDDSIPRAWSKHTAGTSAFNRSKKGQNLP
jgi:multiple RNA-binding domain-containing protein 1